MAQIRTYTEEDYYNLPEDIRAELVNGQLYYMAAPSRIHQKILNFLNTEINLYIRSKKGSCEVYPAPFAVRLFADDDKTVVEPDISVICDLDKLTDRGAPEHPTGSSKSSPKHFQPRLRAQAESIHGCRRKRILDC